MNINQLMGGIFDSLFAIKNNNVNKSTNTINELSKNEKPCCNHKIKALDIKKNRFESNIKITKDKLLYAVKLMKENNFKRSNLLAKGYPIYIYEYIDKNGDLTESGLKKIDGKRNSVSIRNVLDLREKLLNNETNINKFARQRGQYYQLYANYIKADGTLTDKGKKLVGEES